MESVIESDIDTLLELSERAADEIEELLAIDNPSMEYGQGSAALAENLRTVIARIKRIRSESSGAEHHEETKEVNREMERKDA